MATSSSATTNPPASRWSGIGDTGAAFGGASRGGSRGRGGRGGRGGTGGGRGNRDAKKDPEPRHEKSQSVQEKPKAPPAKTSTAAGASDSIEGPPSTPRSKNASRRLSRSTLTPIETQPPTQPNEPSPASPAPRSANRRRRSQASKGPLPPKIKSPAPDDSLIRPGRPVLPSVPHTAPPARDLPPHLASSKPPSSPYEMKSNIDALVEHTRAIAMADNRPSTPGSHIDWAGDDDDSLPDLNDWGIPSITPAQTISPIIVDGLKPLPELIAKPIPTSNPINPVKVSSPLVSNVTLAEYISPSKPNHPNHLKESGKGPAKRQNKAHPSLSARPLQTNGKPAGRWASGRTTTVPSKGKEEKISEPEPEPPKPAAQVDVPATEAVLEIKVDEGSPTATVSDSVEAVTTASSDRSLASSIHAPASGRDRSWDDIGTGGGLAASIHAPGPTSNATSAPATLPTYDSLPKPPRNDPFTHRRPASLNVNSRTSRGGRGGYNQHSRNHSSPHTSSSDGSHRSIHSRPVITGAAMSQLARTIVSAAPKSAPAVAASTD